MYQKNRMISSKIELRDTNTMGKGFFAKETIEINQQLLIVSNETFITCDRYSYFHQFDDLRNQQQISIRVLFAYFLATVSVTPKNILPQHNDIREYFTILPAKMQGLICWTNQELNRINNKQLTQEVKKKKASIQKDYKLIHERVHQAWKTPIRKHECRLFSHVSQLQLVTLELVIYFYSVIESRNVFFRCQQDSSSNVGAIAPLLELFNHSPSPQCEVSSGHRYIVRAIRKIQKDQQIFVSYGHHTQQKFLETYGFLQSLQKPIPQNANYRAQLASEYNKIYARNKKQCDRDHFQNTL